MFHDQERQRAHNLTRKPVEAVQNRDEKLTTGKNSDGKQSKTKEASS